MGLLQAICLILCIFLTPSLFAQSLTEPISARIGHADENWQIIKTEHFDIVVSAKQHDLGLYYAYEAEKAFQNLSTVFSDKPERIVLIVNDTTDVTNGYATRLPYPHIMAFSVPVNEHDSLSEAGNWGRELITHELTHILQFEPARGFYTWLRPILGNIVAPNLLMPLWWKEGMAVEMETRFSPRGRLRSTYQDASIRALLLEKKFSDNDLPQANEVLPSWPYGSRPYLFGSLFFSQLTEDTHQTTASSYLANRQGERVPYFVEEPMNELLNRGYESEYQHMMDEARTNATSELRTIRSQQVTATQAVPQENLSSFQPRYSKAQHLLAFVENTEDKTRLSLLDTLNQKKLTLKNAPSGQIVNLDFHPTERKIIFSKIDQVDSHYNFADLYLYDLDTGETEQLTHSQRARNPSFSDDGAEVTFVTTFSGQTQLRILKLSDRSIRFIINSGMSARYETPLFWDSRTLLAVKVDADGNNHLVSIDLPTKTEKVLPLNFAQIRFLRKYDHTLYFTSSENGVYNLYACTDLQSAKALTNLQTGLWSYDLDPASQSAWGSLLTANGFKVEQLSVAPREVALPMVSNKIKNRYAYTAPDFTYKKYNTTEYSAGQYLWPSYWIPFVSTSSSSKGVFLQAQTSGHDPLNIHTYSLVGSYDSELNKGNFSGVYTNSAFSLPFQLSSVIQSRALGSISDIVQTTTHSVSVLPDLFAVSPNLALQLGVHLQETDYLTKSEHVGPFASLAYKDYQQTIFQVSPENGWGFFLRYEKNFKTQDETNYVAQDYDKVLFTTLGYASPSFFPRHHAVMLRLSGLMTFESVYGRFGDSSSSIFLAQDGLVPQYVIRGYPPAQFFGRSLMNANFEYRFPVTRIDRGSGSDAYFLKQISGALVADGISVEGNALAEDQSIQALKLNESFWSAGFEFKLETTVGYVLPMNFVLGYYYPFSPKYASSAQLGLSLQIGGL